MKQVRPTPPLIMLTVIWQREQRCSFPSFLWASGQKSWKVYGWPGEFGISLHRLHKTGRQNVSFQGNCIFFIIFLYVCLCFHSHLSFLWVHLVFIISWCLCGFLSFSNGGLSFTWERVFNKAERWWGRRRSSSSKEFLYNAKDCWIKWKCLITFITVMFRYVFILFLCLDNVSCKCCLNIYLQMSMCELKGGF